MWARWSYNITEELSWETDNINQLYLRQAISLMVKHLEAILDIKIDCSFDENKLINRTDLDHMADFLLCDLTDYEETKNRIKYMTGRDMTIYNYIIKKGISIDDIIRALSMRPFTNRRIVNYIHLIDIHMKLRTPDKIPQQARGDVHYILTLFLKDVPKRYIKYLCSKTILEYHGGFKDKHTRCVHYKLMYVVNTYNLKPKEVQLCINEFGKKESWMI